MWAAQSGFPVPLTRPPQFLGHLQVADQLQRLSWSESLVFLLLVSDVLMDGCLVPTHRRDDIPTRPEVRPDTVALRLAVHPSQMDRPLAPEVANHLRHRVLGRDRDQPRHMIGQEMPFEDTALLWPRQVREHLAEVSPPRLVQRLASALRKI